MSFCCPVCNGFFLWSPVCPQCRQAARDLGRIADFFGPYAPYRPIDEMKRSDGFVNLASRQCTHYIYCPSCDMQFFSQVDEWNV